MKKFFSILLVAFLSLSVLSGCSRKQVELIDYHSDKAFTNKYVKDLDVEHCEYETIRIGYGLRGNLSLGPTDPRYRGIITISEDEAKELFKSYNWIEVNDFADINLGNIYLPDMEAEKWYSSFEFSNDYMYMVQTYYCLFNGKDTIIFDVQTF
ncbi:MAG: hypothetical protein K6G75_02570 [Lachnospiraceae bacterium]|nr:hypothetical protein [Lachnospiraceae bacterium]